MYRQRKGSLPLCNISRGSFLGEKSQILLHGNEREAKIPFEHAAKDNDLMKNKSTERRFSQTRRGSFCVPQYAEDKGRRKSLVTAQPSGKIERTGSFVTGERVGSFGAHRDLEKITKMFTVHGGKRHSLPQALRDIYAYAGDIR